MRNPTIADIRSLGFEWPKYPLIEQYCVMDELQVDLLGTIGKLTKTRSEINGVPGQRADPEHQYDQAVAYLREIQAAAEQKLREPADFLRALWPMLGVSPAAEVRPLTKAEVHHWLQAGPGRCAWTEFRYTQLRWLSRQEVEKQVIPLLVDPERGFPWHGYLASEWRTEENEIILVFCLCYWPI